MLMWASFALALLVGGTAGLWTQQATAAETGPSLAVTIGFLKERLPKVYSPEAPKGYLADDNTVQFFADGEGNISLNQTFDTMRSRHAFSLERNYIINYVFNVRDISRIEDAPRISAIGVECRDNAQCIKIEERETKTFDSGNTRALDFSRKSEIVFLTIPTQREKIVKALSHYMRLTATTSAADPF